MKLGWNAFEYDAPVALLVLDSVGYEEFREADTTNIDSASDHEFEAWGQGTFTGPSTQSMMLGYLPWAGSETQVFGRVLWLPDSFKERNYRTMAWASLPYAQSHYFDRGFDFFKDMRRTDMTVKMVKESVSHIENTDGKYFVFMNFGCTHRPYDYGETRTEWKERNLQRYNYEGTGVSEKYLEYLRSRQIESVEYVDRKAEPLLNKLADDDALVIILSDHGTCFGEGGVCGHGIGGREAVLKQLNVPLLFRLPGNRK